MTERTDVVASATRAEAQYTDSIRDFVRVARSVNQSGSVYPFVATRYLSGPRSSLEGDTRTAAIERLGKAGAGSGYSLTADGVMQCGKDVSDRACRTNCVGYGAQLGAFAVAYQASSADAPGACRAVSTAEEAGGLLGGVRDTLPGGTWLETAWTPAMPTYGMTGMFSPRLELGGRVLSAWLRTSNNVWKLARCYVENGATYMNANGSFVQSLTGSAGLAMLTLEGEWPRRDLKLQDNYLYAGDAPAVFVEAGDTLRYASVASTARDCECIPCGSAQPHPYTSGFCSVSNNSCDAGAGSASTGCYSSVDDTCDCSTKKTAPGTSHRIVVVSKAQQRDPPSAYETDVISIDYPQGTAKWRDNIEAGAQVKTGTPYGITDNTATELHQGAIKYGPESEYWKQDDTSILTSAAAVKATSAECRSKCNADASCRGFTTRPGDSCTIHTPADISGPQMNDPGSTALIRKPGLVDDGGCTGGFVPLDAMSTAAAVKEGTWNPCGASHIGLLKSKQAAVSRAADEYQRRGARMAAAMNSLDERENRLDENMEKGRDLREQIMGEIPRLSGRIGSSRGIERQDARLARDQKMLADSRFTSALIWGGVAIVAVGAAVVASRR